MPDKLLVLGVSFRTAPLSLRERVASISRTSVSLYSATQSGYDPMSAMTSVWPLRLVMSTLPLVPTRATTRAWRPRWRAPRSPPPPSRRPPWHSWTPPPPPRARARTPSAPATPSPQPSRSRVVLVHAWHRVDRARYGHPGSDISGDRDSSTGRAGLPWRTGPLNHFLAEKTYQPPNSRNASATGIGV